MEIIKSHNKKSRKCTPADIPVITKDAKEMISLCSKPLGIKSGALAIAHCQVTDKEPLRFFVTQEGKIYINPEITSHTKVFVDSQEGCMSFPMNKDVIVKRYNKVTVTYQELDGYGFTDIKELNTGGKMAKVFQHEIDHFEGVNVYGR